MRYFRLWLSFFKMSWMADLEYRLNLVVRVIGEFAWYAAQLSIFEELYHHTSTISGWDVHGMAFSRLMRFLQAPMPATEDPELASLDPADPNYRRNRFFLLPCRASGSDLTS